MKLLIFLAGYFPALNYGGPPVSINNLCKALPNYMEKFIITSNHEKGSTERFENISNGWNRREEANVMYLNDNEIKYSKIKQIINEIQPDLIYLNSIFNTKFILIGLRVSKKFNIPVFLAPRGELYQNALKMKQFKKKVYLSLVKIARIFENVYFQSTSFEETKQIKSILKIKNEKIFQLDNLPTFPDIGFQKHKKISGELKCVFISRVHPKKNLKYAIEVLSKLEGNIIYDIYGYIEDRKYWKEIQNEITLLPRNIVVNYCGILDRKDIFRTLNNYDIFLFPTLGENYGQAIVEAMLARCPVVISDETPWTDINNYGSGRAISLSNKKHFVEYLNILVNINNEQYLDLVKKNNKYIKEKLNIDKLVKKYIEIFHVISNYETYYDNLTKV